MESQRSFQLPLLALLIFAILGTSQSKPLGTSQSKRSHFELRVPGTNELCAMLDIDLQVNIQVSDQSKVIDNKTLTSEDEGIIVVGDCLQDARSLLVKFAEKTFWSITFKAEKGESTPVTQYRVFIFSPEDIFGSSMAHVKRQIFSDPQRVYQDEIADSYLCTTPDNESYIDVTPPSEDLKFEVNVKVLSIQAQGFNITGEKYGPAEKCKISV